jgi:hypothetical protein
MRNGGRVLLAVLNWYIRIKIREAAFDPNHSVKDIALSIAASIQKLPDSVFKSAELAVDWADVSGETIGLSISLGLAVDFLHVMYIKDK